MRAEIRAGLLLLLVGVFAGWLLVEATLRWVYREEEVSSAYWGLGAFAPHVTAGYQHRPGFQGRAYRKGAFDVEVAISDQGLRQRDLQEQISYPRRVLFLGDSFTFGLGVLEEQGFVSRLAASLNRLGLGVVNAGQTGYSVAQEQAFGQSWIESTRPEWVVVVLFPTNDVEGDYFRDYERVEVRYGVRLSSTRRLDDPVSDFLRTHSYLWMLWDRRQNAWNAKLRRRDLMSTAASKMDSLIAPALESLRAIETDASRLGAETAVVMIPGKGGEGPFFVALRAAVDSSGLPILDLSRAGFGPQDHFESDGHWNSDGHSRAAAAILEFLVDALGMDEVPDRASGHSAEKLETGN